MPLSPLTAHRLAAVYGATAVLCGAFGAHGLSQRNPPLEPRLIKSWETASQYLLVHAGVLLGLSRSQGTRDGAGRWAADFLALGAGLFSGSIYGLVLGSGSVRRVLGPLTPIGGSLMILGWGCMLF